MTPALPQGWSIRTLAEVVAADAPIVYGILQPGPDHADGVPYVRPTEVNRDRIELERLRRTSEDIAKRYARSALKGGDVILSIVGTIGKVAVVPASLEGGNITQSSARVRANPQLLTPSFLAWALRAPVLTRQFGADRLGTAVPRLNLSHVRTFEIPLPPLPTQRAIVAKIEQLFSELDAGEAALKRAQRNLERYRASLLKAAVEGRLTEEWRKKNPPEETGAELLQRILTDRRKQWEEEELAKYEARGKPPPKNWREKYKEPEGPDTRGLPELPEGWCWATVDQVGDVVTGTTPSTRDPGNYGGELPFFKPTDLDQGSEVVEARQYLTAQGWKKARILEPFAVLVTCIGATIGKTGMSTVRSATNQQINAIDVAGDATLGKYLFVAFSSPWGQRQILANSSATTLPIINKTRFSRLPVPLPPKSEMLRIARRLDGLFDAAERLEVDRCAAATRLRLLRRAILKTAFDGDLVPLVVG